MLIQVKENATDIIYDNDMSKDKHSILEIHFCTSYTQVVVQDKIEEGGQILYPKHSIIIPPLNSRPNWIDEIATQGDNAGIWIK
jgi:hypothetical protein